MAEVNVDYDQVSSVASRLKSEGAEIIQELKNLQANVTELLTSQGGLWLQQSSPVMSAQYTEFNQSLSNAITNLGTFGDSFNGIVDNLRELDTSLAKPAN